MILGIAIVAGLASFEGYILWRYPDFRRAFVEHWQPSAVAERMDRWAERQESRR
jgi:hypothetical protein